MRGKLQLPQLWEVTKYVSWPHSHDNPIVRVPRPSGLPESKSIKRLAHEYDTFEACIDYRDRRGVEIWGEWRWEELLLVPKRSVAKHRDIPAGPITGVNHFDCPGRAPVWAALWYELQPDGSRKRRSKHFSYGTQNARYRTSEQAMEAAIELREAMESRWYCVRGVREDREVSRLE